MGIRVEVSIPRSKGSRRFRVEGSLPGLPTLNPQPYSTAPTRRGTPTCLPASRARTFFCCVATGMGGSKDTGAFLGVRL